MNLAIVIGVSQYSDAKNNLPGCKNDADAIYQILQKTEKFNPILYINDKETSAKTKELITNFVSEHKGTDINELYFYYSGHGEFYNDEFYYILSDYNPKKKNQTSLQNSEIDDLFRTINPNLLIKVIDACQSGAAYIKESGIVSKYFNDTKKGFKKCYFLNSSLNDQSSYQDEKISFFTLSFINALKDFNTEEIRYKDIIDYIADEFEGNSEQTPFYIIQADYTEKFCTITKTLKKYVDNFSFELLDSPEDKGTNSKVLSLTELVKKDAKDYADKEKAIETLNLIKTEFESLSFDIQIDDLYSINVSFTDDYSSLPKKSVIGNWIKDNNKDYFAKEKYEKVRDYSIPNYSSAKFFTLNNSLRAIDSDEIRYKSIVTGFEQNVEVPFKVISLDLTGKFPNLVNYNCKVIFLLSLKNIRFFYFITNYFTESWDSKTLNTNDIEWITSEFKITSDKPIVNGVSQIKDKLESKVLKELFEKFKTSSPDINEKGN